jgi:hypothetical protein
MQLAGLGVKRRAGRSVSGPKGANNRAAPFKGAHYLRCQGETVPCLGLSNGEKTKNAKSQIGNRENEKIESRSNKQIGR